MLVKDDIGCHGGPEGSGIAARDRQRRRVGEPKCASILGEPLVLEASGPAWQTWTI